jgi:hypothetical protein
MTMKNKWTAVLMIAVLSSIIWTGALRANEVAEKAAIAASSAWLSLVDEGNYVESWNQASALFRAAVPQEQWQQSLKAFRLPLGKMVVRKLESKQYTRSLPGAPDGEYVVIQYETTFEKKQSAIETITLMLDKGGIWRVSGYYIK